MRNNQDRFGAKPSSGEVPSAPTLQFVTPTEFVALPSRGTYPAGHPLHNKDTIEIYYMTARDEDILSSEALLKKGLAVERFIENVIVDKSIEASSLLTGDRNAIIIAARSSGYGNAYETTVKCPSCGRESKEVFDIDNPTIKEAVHEDEELGFSRGDDGLYVTKLPQSGYTIKFRLLTGKDELEMVNLKLKKKKTRIAGLDKTITEQFKRMIMSIEGLNDKSMVYRFVNVMTARDSKHLKACYLKANPNIEIKNDFECLSCGHEQELEVPLNADFFWPDS